MQRLWCLALLVLLFTASHVNAQSVWTDKKISSRQKGQLLTFAQDIVSLGWVPNLNYGKIPNEDLVRFGIYQVGLRHQEAFQDLNKGFDIRLPSRYVSASVKRYFGKRVRHQSVGKWQGQYDWAYRKGFYYGESVLFEQLGPEKVKQIRVYGVGKRYLTASVNYVDAMASSDSPQEVVVKTKMVLKRVSAKGRSRYILIAFKYLTPDRDTAPEPINALRRHLTRPEGRPLYAIAWVNSALCPCMSHCTGMSHWRVLRGRSDDQPR